MGEILLRDEVFQIQGAIFEVSRVLGIGFVEAVYGESLALEFSARQIPFVAAQPLTLQYKGQRLRQTYIPDFVCFGAVVVELKAVRGLLPERRAQVINYLKASGLQLGLLANFGAHPKAQVERVVFDLQHARSALS